LVLKLWNERRKTHISWSFPDLRRTATYCLLRPGQVSNVRVFAMGVR
jgi:hypothetical protein